jgi:LuxR family transcriptional regulator, maltose regulon positive regulatory protein
MMGNHIKTASPQVPSGTISRTDLESLLTGALSKRLTMVTAGGGWGKSTLLASWIRTISIPFLWYNVDATDQDERIFLPALASGIADALQKSLNYRDGSGGDGQLHHALNMVFSTYPEMFLVILEDYHLAAGSDSFRDLVRLLIDKAPANLHVLISSRTIPAFPVRLQTYGETAEFDHTHLSFTTPQVLRFLNSNYRLSLSEQDAMQIEKATEGWPAGVRLAGQILSQHERVDISRAVTQLKKSVKSSSFFHVEILENLPEELKGFLLRSALLNSFSAELCAAILGYENANRLIKDLLDRGLFLVRLDSQGEWFRYHHLFQDFLLLEAQRTLGKEAVAAIHSKAATYFHNERKWDLALSHALQAERYEQASAIIGVAFTTFQSMGRATALLQWIDRIPESVQVDYPSLLCAKAWTLFFLTRWNEAVATLKEAKERLKGTRDALLLAQTYHLLMAINFTWDDHQENVRLMEEVLSVFPPSHPILLPCYAQYALSLMQLGRSREAGEVWSMIENHPATKENIEIFMNTIPLKGLNYYCFLGQFENAVHVLEKGISFFSKQDLYGRYGRFHAFLGFTRYEMGLFQDALGVLEKSLDDLSRTGNSESLVPIGALFALNGLALGNIELAGKGIEISDRGMALGHTSKLWKECYFHGAKAVFLFKQGDVKGFQLESERAAALIERQKLWFDRYLIYTEVGPCLALGGKAEEGANLLERALESVRTAGAPYAEARVRLLLASILHDQGRRSQSMDHLRHVLTLCRENRYDFLFLRKEQAHARKMLPLVASEKDWFSYVAPLLVSLHHGSAAPLLHLLDDGDPAFTVEVLKSLGQNQCRDAEKGLAPYLKSKDKKFREAASEAITRLRNLPPLPLRIEVLGGFRVFRGEQEIPNRAWKRKTAKSLFKYLLLNSSKELSLPHLMEVILPEVESDDGKALLHQAASALRNALEPGIGPKQESAYLKVRDGLYSLILPTGSEVDAFAFEKLCHKAADAKQRGDLEGAFTNFLNAIAIYRGDLMEENVFEDWSSLPRDKYRELFLQALGDVACEHYVRANWLETIRYANLIMNKEPWAESAYLLLMKAHLAQGDRARAMKTYARCKTALHEELSVRPGSEIETLFRQISQ